MPTSINREIYGGKEFKQYCILIVMSSDNQTYQTITLQGRELLERAYAVRINNLEASIQLATKAATLGEQIKNQHLVAEAKNHLGLFYMIIGRFEDAKSSASDALVYFEKQGDLKGIADAKYVIAGVCYKTDDYHVGLEFLLDCLYLYRRLNDYGNQARVLKSMGTIYEYFGDQENAIISYHESIESARLANDPALESNAYNPLSGIYLKRGKHELALSTIEKSIAIKEQTKDIRGLAFALYGRGKVFIKIKHYDEALADLNRSLGIQMEMGDKLGESMAYNKLGYLHYELKKYTEAKHYLLNALELADQYNIRFIRYKALYNLHLLAKSEGDAEKALEYLEKYMVIKESTINSHTYNVIKSYQAISKVKTLEHEAEIQRSKTEIIEKKNAELDSFFYRVSHDLKGPISSLLGLHNLVKLEIQDEQAKHYFEMYQSQIMRINNIVMDLINLTRMNHSEINSVKIDFNTLLEDCIDAYRYLPHYKAIRFIKNIDPSIEFYSEWAIVNTILQNLIENAIKYSRGEKDSFVRVAISHSHAHVTIEVQDNGIGIEPDFQNKIFNMFFRANDHVDGTGLGLYILKRAVERLHGEVRFTSKVNEGTTFTVLLPTPHKRSISNDINLSKL
jgi:signal transduction histidine kinase